MEADFGAGLGADATLRRTDGSASDAGPAIGFTLGAALLKGPFTAGLRADFGGTVFGHENIYYLADLGGHFRTGAAKVTGVLEVGAHGFPDPGGGLSTAYLPTVGARASLDLTSGFGPKFGVWAQAHYDVGTTTVDLNQLGGASFMTGLQVGFDVQPSARTRGRGVSFSR